MVGTRPKKEGLSDGASQPIFEPEGVPTPSEGRPNTPGKSSKGCTFQIGTLWDAQQAPSGWDVGTRFSPPRGGNSVRASGRPSQEGIRFLLLSPYEVEVYLGDAYWASRLRRSLRLGPDEPVSVGRVDRFAYGHMTRAELPFEFRFTITSRRAA